MKEWYCTLPDEALEALSNQFKLLSEPMRMKILLLLAVREQTIQEIVKTVDAKQTNISNHLALLLEGNIVGKRRNGSKIYYSLADKSFWYTSFISSKSISKNLKDKLQWAQNMNPNLSS